MVSHHPSAKGPSSTRYFRGELGGPSDTTHMPLSGGGERIQSRREMILPAGRG
jgi:hypothetical protein